MCFSLCPKMVKLWSSFFLRLFVALSKDGQNIVKQWMSFCFGVCCSLCQRIVTQWSPCFTVLKKWSLRLRCVTKWPPRLSVYLWSPCLSVSVCAWRRHTHSRKKIHWPVVTERKRKNQFSDLVRWPYSGTKRHSSGHVR